MKASKLPQEAHPLPSLRCLLARVIKDEGAKRVPFQHAICTGLCKRHNNQNEVIFSRRGRPKQDTSIRFLLNMWAPSCVRAQSKMRGQRMDEVRTPFQRAIGTGLKKYTTIKMGFSFQGRHLSLSTCEIFGCQGKMWAPSSQRTAGAKTQQPKRELCHQVCCHYSFFIFISEPKHKPFLFHQHVLSGELRMN